MEKGLPATEASSRVGRPSLKSERVMARVSQEQKRLLQRGAEIRGQTLTEFVVAAAQEAATRAIVDQEVIELSVRDSRAFAEGLLDRRRSTTLCGPRRAAIRKRWPCK
jgi:uncharacterized protein (DUF1778 family)